MVGYDNSNVLVNKHDQIFTHLYKGNVSNFNITLVFPNNVFHSYKLNLSPYILELIEIINREIPIKFGAPPSPLGRHTLGVLNNSIKLESDLAPKTDLHNNNYGTGEPWNGLGVYINALRSDGEKMRRINIVTTNGREHSVMLIPDGTRQEFPDTTMKLKVEVERVRDRVMEKPLAKNA